MREWRSRTTQARGIPAHCTLTFPFAPATRELLAELRRLASSFAPFDYTLARCDRFATFLYLAPEPPEPFVELTCAVLARWPEWPRYGGEHGDEIVPHVTAAQGEPAILGAAEADIAPLLPVRARAAELLLLEQTDEAGAAWRTHSRFPLGRAGEA